MEFARIGLVFVLLIDSFFFMKRVHAMVEAPIAKKEPRELTIHGHTRVDPYYWLRDRDHPDVMKYLEAENAYTAAMMADTKSFQEELFEEMKGRIKKDDVSAPYYYRGYFYYTRTEGDFDYPFYCRKKGTLSAKEEIFLNVNEYAKPHKYYNISSAKISPNSKMLAFSEDTKGRRIYTIRFKNLETGKALDLEIPNVTGNVVWANDSQTVFYTKQDPVTLRSHQVYRMSLSEPQKAELIYEEKDETFSVYVSKSKSERIIMASSHSTLSSEIRYLSADKPEEDWTVFQERIKDVEYAIEDGMDRFYIYTNFEAKNFQIMESDLKKTGHKNWKTVIKHDPEVYLEDLEVFQDYLVISEKKEGLNRYRVYDRKKKDSHHIDFPETTYLSHPYVNRVYDSDSFYFTYESMTTPDSVYSYQIPKRKKTLVKREEVLGSFNPDHYESKRLYAKAKDGTKIPISIVHRRGIKLNSSNPTLIYGYGSYGINIDPSFNSNRISLLDRGFIFAIAHVRGSSMMGRSWYEDGKLLKKMNTFEDFISCSEHLIKEKYTSSRHLYAMGGSAGGMLMGGIINLRPDLYHGVIAAVPFVDVVTTMLDDSIPLTTGEYDEWGNPNQEEYYKYMLTYSPYDNIKKQNYPHLLITTGLHDSQVQYWEPAKWAAKLRDLKTDKNLLLLKINTEAGHSGASGRFNYLKEIALDYAFLLKLEGIKSNSL